MKNSGNKTKERHVTVDGMMTISQYENGLHALDFECCDEVHLAAFSARCKVQQMHDGNVYITQLPGRKRRKPLFREDNSALSLGRNGRYYFVFSLPDTEIGKLPRLLVSQAGLIARKVMKNMIDNH